MVHEHYAEKLYYVRFKVLTAVTTKNTAYSDGILCSLAEIYQCYAVTCCLHVKSTTFFSETVSF
jgi:hypothetical protein